MKGEKSNHQMEPSTRTRDPDGQPKGFLLPNGAVKKPQRPPPTDDVLYRECLKNHAASLGGHALDGCGEFMPSSSANPADPTSLKCAACGCHRNFHRRIAGPSRATGSDDGIEGEGERDGGQEGDAAAAAAAAAGHRWSCSPSPQPYFSSAPHMLLGLREGAPVASPVAAVPPQRKRFRSKFSPEQKDRIVEFSERLGWRLQRRDEGLVERGVFKVWMHNNKNQLFESPGFRREEARSSAMDSAAAASSAHGPAVETNGSDGDSGGADGIDNGLVMNGSSSSS